MISLVINTKDAQDKVEACIKSALGLFDELIIVDDGSKDSTVKIAEKYTDKIFKHESMGFVEPARNYAIDKAKGDWILILDTDEQISRKLKDELKKISKVKNIDFVKIPRKNIIFGKWIRHSVWWPDYQIRFFRKNKVEWRNEIHSPPISTGKALQLAENENLAIIHNNYETIGQYLNRMDQYTDIEVSQWMKNGKKIHWSNAIRWPADDFLKTFFLEEGFKDGIHGLILSTFQAFYAFVYFSKVWERQEKFKDVAEENFLAKTIEEFSNVSRDFKYWVNTKMMEENPIKKIYYKIKRRLR